MTNAQILSIREANIRIANNLEKMIPIKEKDENPYNGKNHSNEDVEFIMSNLTLFNQYNSKQMKESLNYFKSKI